MQSEHEALVSDDEYSDEKEFKYMQERVDLVIQTIFFGLMIAMILLIYYVYKKSKQISQNNNNQQLPINPNITVHVTPPLTQNNNFHEDLRPVQSYVTSDEIEDDDLGFFFTIDFDDMTTMDVEIDPPRTSNLLPSPQQSTRRESQELPPNYEDPPPSYDEVVRKVP
ncbi:CLUMA_CG007730, isoform A [Clunio marinus]|uniref:CLUMA_CG007730, isoform A n=1 Tax=Clunio marinus TaxID=568069 RepID=A0A1J1I1J4_9DIPT|nr:CLUMA_CG007730, isoform A [Clunio marinus]